MLPDFTPVEGGGGERIFSWKLLGRMEPGHWKGMEKSVSTTQLGSLCLASMYSVRLQVFQINS